MQQEDKLISPDKSIPTSDGNGADKEQHIDHSQHKDQSERQNFEPGNEHTRPANQSSTGPSGSNSTINSPRDEEKPKVPKPLRTDVANAKYSGLPPISSSPELPLDSNSSKLDKAILANLNKSLKVKQKIINTKEPQPKNPALISEVINRSPQSSAFPNNISNTSVNATSNNPQNPPGATNTTSGSSTTNAPPPPPVVANSSSSNAAELLDNVPNLQLNEPNTSQPPKDTKKSKKVAKQNSTRTDFFAAKLASAVDDVDTSDSDETFVYENNINDEFNDTQNDDMASIENNENSDPDMDNNSEANLLENNNQAPFSQDGVTNTHPNGDETSVKHNQQHVSINSLHNTNNNDDENNETFNDDMDTTTTDNDNLESPPNTMGHKPEPIDLSNVPKYANPDSIGSSHSTKHPSLKAPKPINSSKPIPNASLNSSNQFLDNLVNKPLRPPTQRSLSSYSIQSHQQPQQSQQLQTESMGRRSVSPYNNSSNTSSHGFNSGLSKRKSGHELEKSSYNDIEDVIDTSDHEARGLKDKDRGRRNPKGRRTKNKSEGDHDIGHDADNDDNDEDTNLESDDNAVLESAEDVMDDEDNGDEDDEEVDVDDVSSHDSYNSGKMNSSSNTTVPQKPNNSKPISSIKKHHNLDSSNSIASKTTTSNKKRSITSSSKLRSTTSKLFDKKGAQPRRYSIVPDDIDIEDFDDELFYYDNNVRFPYNSNNSLNFSEQSPLINNQQSKIPHYRSLNLTPNAATGANNNLRNKSRRYLSTGQYPFQAPNSPPHNNLNAVINNDTGTGDIFPFPYPEQQKNQNPYYFGFDEYDEETGSINENQFDRVSRKASSKFNFAGNSLHPHDSPFGTNNHPHLSSNNHFLLPRKSSFMNSNYNYVKRILYTLVSIIGILSIGFIMGFVIATTKDLSNVSITDIQNPVVSQDELVFNIMVEALNPGWFTVDISEVELDIFAKSGYLPDVITQNHEDKVVDDLDFNSVEKNAVETVLLGSVYNLESTISFPGGFFNRDTIKQAGEIKLVLPGKNLTNFQALENSDNGNTTIPDNSAKWEIISKNPFDLIIRGILKYNLPLTKNTKSVVVTKTSYIDPTIDTGKLVPKRD